MEENLKRINNYLSFLRTTEKVVLLCGIFFLLIGILIYFGLPGSNYHNLWIGFSLAGLFITIRSLIERKNSAIETDFSSRDQMERNMDEIKKKLSFFSAVLILSILSCLVMMLIRIGTNLIIALIPIIIFAALEFVFSGLILFRLSVLKQELYKGE